MLKQLLKQSCFEYYTKLLWYRQKGAFHMQSWKNLGLIKMLTVRGCTAFVRWMDLITVERVIGKRWHMVAAGVMK